MIQTDNQKEQYEAVLDFLEIPSSMDLGLTHAIVEDRAGRLYLYQNYAPCMLVFDAAGRFLDSWGEDYAGGAHGCFIHAEGDEEFIYLANTDLGTVTKNTLSGDELWQITTPRQEDLYRGVNEHWQNKRFVPTQVAVTPDQRVYIVDGYGQPYCHIFDQKDGKPHYLSSFGGNGDSAPGSLNEPHGVEVSERHGRKVILIANRRNHRVDSFSLDGEFVETVIHKDDLRYLTCPQ
ncbi:MAG: hypothetical protein GY755_09700 [Chloroflexi bacterium]|nr:hypothetical protein [Chloroflexota bacterium]